MQFVKWAHYQVWFLMPLQCLQTAMFWWDGHSLPSSVPCGASHTLPTFFDPVPHRAGRKRLWCARLCLFESVLRRFTACQNCWFTNTFAEGQFWKGCHTSTNGLLFKHRALLHTCLSSCHQWGCTRPVPGFLSVCTCYKYGILPWWHCKLPTHIGYRGE